MDEYETLADVASRLDEVMEGEAPYLNGKYTLENLARSAGTNRTYASRSFSKMKKTSYTAYCNKRRIKVAEKLLLEENNDGTYKYKIPDVALMSGFSSERTFYRAMLKYSGLTPSKFRFVKKYSINMF